MNPVDVKATRENCCRITRFIRVFFVRFPVRGALEMDSDAPRKRVLADLRAAEGGWTLENPSPENKDLAAPSAYASTLDLRIMASSDLHMHVLPYDYVIDAPSEQFGFARVATLIRSARSEVENSLLFDNGDLFHGTPMGDAFSDRLRDPRVHNQAHPMMAAMKALGYDAITLGNHDFDNGVDLLSRAIGQAGFPVVSSNAVLVNAESDKTIPRPMVQPFALLDRKMTDKAGALHRLRIGVLGFLPPGTVRDLRDRHLKVETSPIAETARIMAAHLRAMGADLVIALAHSGIDADSDDPALENAVVPLARTEGIDAIVSGHDHQVFPGPLRKPCPAADSDHGTIHGTPVVSPGFWGSHLGIIDLCLGRSHDGAWSVLSGSSQARPVARMNHAAGRMQALVPPDAEITKMMSVMHDATLTRVRRQVGETRDHLHSYFALIAPSPALQIVHQAKDWFTRREIAGTELEGLPIVTSTPPFKAGGLPGPGFFTHVKPGPINLRAIADLYLHRNDLCALRVTVAGLTEWLERAASVYLQVEVGAHDQPILSPITPPYLFETVSGVDYEIDLSAPPRYTLEGHILNENAHRIGPLKRDGRVMAPDEEVLLVTNSHRATGGGGFGGPGLDTIALDVPVSIRDVLMSYFTHIGPVSLDKRPNWRIAPLAGTSVQLRSAPQAAAHIHELPSLDLQVAGVDEDGFLLITLNLDPHTDA